MTTQALAKNAVHPETQQRKTACILCSRNCGLEVDIQGQQFVKIRGDDDHPESRGYICQKAARLEHYQNHADRLTTPLKRNAQGGFDPVSWEQALGEIAERLVAVRESHGGDSFAFVGGGGQGNHLATAYSGQLLGAMRSRYVYNSLAQEKTGDFWVNGRLFGRQDCHISEGVAEADYVLFIGTNPFQAHGIPNARDTLKALRKDPNRTFVVVDPRRTETARHADIFLQIKPGTDAYMLAAMLATIVRENLYDTEFVAAHCDGFDAVRDQLLQVPIEEYIARAGLELEQVQNIARDFARADCASVRVDLGTQHTLNTTLNAYLEKLLYLLTGNFGKPGGNNLHTALVPIVGNTDERIVIEGKPLKRSAVHKMMPIGGMYPPSILPDEILQGGIKAVVVDSANVLLSWPDTQALERAFASLDTLVVIDVAMTETARAADYVLPASSQFEKWEATGFNLEFPDNYFHLRDPLFKPTGDSLPEAEIYTRLLEKMGALPPARDIARLERIAAFEPTWTGHLLFLSQLKRLIKKHRQCARVMPSIMFKSLGRHLPAGAASAAFLLPLCLAFAAKFPRQVRRTGLRGGKLTLGAKLFHAILGARSGITISKHDYDEVWELVRTDNGRIHLAIDEMLSELQGLQEQQLPGQDYPFVLMAGERRSYNANQIYRNPAWRKVDRDGALRIHPDDAASLALGEGDAAMCRTRTGSIEVVVEFDEGLRRGVVTLPHGYGMRYQGGEPNGPQINRLTAAADCDPISKTPYHKYVPAFIERAAAG